MPRLLSHLQNNIWLIAIATIFFTACEKDPNLSDSPLNPGNNQNLMLEDSFEFTAFTVEEEPLNATTLSDVWLGRIEDSRTGTTETSFYTQLRLTTTGIDIGTNAALDSAFLYLYYDESYGPRNQTLTIQLYEVLEEIDPDNGYKTNETLSVGATVIGEATAVVLEEDGLIKIPLTTAFGNELLNQIGTTTFESNDNFLNYLNGIYVTANGTGGDGMAHVRLTNSLTSLLLHYSSDTPTDSLYRFQVDNQAVWLSKYESDYTGSEAAVALADPTNNDEELYIMPFSSLKAQINVPDVSHLADAVINDARLIVYQTDYAGAVTSDFPEPNNLFLYQNLSDTSFNFLPGFSISDFAEFGGDKQLVIIDGVQTYQYEFDITEYIQGLAKGELETASIYLTALSNNDPARVVLGGGNHPQLPIKMKILFTLTE